MNKKRVLAIIGSASKESSNLRLVEHIAELLKEDIEFDIYNDLKTLPHFEPECSPDNAPFEVKGFLDSVEKCDAILISTPEYIYSIPAGLKNAIEWCVATTVFSDKRVGIITASASGQKGHEELQMIMKTVGASLDSSTLLVISGIKGKISRAGVITDKPAKSQLEVFAVDFQRKVNQTDD